MLAKHSIPPAPLSNRSPFEQLQEQFATWRAQLPGGLLDRVRAGSFEKLKNRNSPRVKDSPYRALRLAQIAEFAKSCSFQKGCTLPNSWCHAQISKWRFPECASSCLVFVDGQWSQELSTLQGCLEDIEVLDLPTAAAAFSQHLLRRSVADEEEFFALASAALAQAGCVIYLKPGARPSAPVQLLHLTSQETSAHESMAHFSRVHLIASAGSELHLLQTGPPTLGWRHHFLECTLEKDARVDLDEHIPRQEGGFYFRATRALLHKNARFYAASFTSGGTSLWQDFSAKLVGEKSQVQLAASNALTKRLQSTISAQVQHSAPGAVSHQLVRSVLDDCARAQFRGAILVDRGAGDTLSYQLNNNLILSDRAIAETQPNLEILHDEVKASHGATMGRISEEELFYLQSRGLERAFARRLLIRGFLELGIGKLRCESMREAARLDLATLL